MQQMGHIQHRNRGFPFEESINTYNWMTCAFPEGTLSESNGGQFSGSSFRAIMRRFALLLYHGHLQIRVPPE
jgi:hypothetical protein